MTNKHLYSFQRNCRGEKALLPAFSISRQTSRNTLFLLVLLIALCGVFTACAGKKTIDSEPSFPDPPEWVRTGQAPQVSGSICAVGVAGPTFFRTDAVMRAEEEARGALARTLTVKIHTGMIHIQDEDGGVMDRQTVFEVSAYANEKVLEGARIMEVWFDEPGWGFAQKPEYTYALACIDATTKPSAGIQ